MSLTSADVRKYEKYLYRHVYKTIYKYIYYIYIYIYYIVFIKDKLYSF